MCLFHQWFLLVGVALAGACATAVFVPRAERAGVAELTLASVRARADVLWIDARSEEAFLRGHVAGAILLNEDNWSQAIAEMLAQWQLGQTVIVYCGSRECRASHAVAERLRGKEYGLENVFVLKGGWDEYVTAQKKTGGNVK
jgi:rhodanese-related sulfurtransferase